MIGACSAAAHSKRRIKERALKAEQRAQARQHKIALVEKWNASGLTQREFCRHEGLEERQFSSWKRLVNVARERAEHMQVGGSTEGNAVRLPDARKKHQTAGRQARDLQQAAAAVKQQSFVPVHLVDVVAEDCSASGATGIFDCVLEVVLKRGQTVRVAPSCQPQFLSAVVSSLDRP